LPRPFSTSSWRWQRVDLSQERGFRSVIFGPDVFGSFEHHCVQTCGPGPFLPLTSSTEPVLNIMRIATVGEKCRSSTKSLMPFGRYAQ